MTESEGHIFEQTVRRALFGVFISVAAAVTIGASAGGVQKTRSATAADLERRITAGCAAMLRSARLCTTHQTPREEVEVALSAGKHRIAPAKIECLAEASVLTQVANALCPPAP